MPVRKNGYYADPSLGAAFDNLAEVFKTPSGADVNGYANAEATRAKASRLAELFANPNGPDFDRQNIAVGNYAPTSSFLAQSQNDATARRGQDTTAASATNVANINNKGLWDREIAKPIILSDGQTANLPAQTVEATGLPAMFRGNVTTAPGQTVTTPTGEVIAGTPKPLTDAEVKGAILNRQSPEDQRLVSLQGVGTTPVLNAKGEPEIVMTPDAAGRTPYNVDNSNPQIANWKDPATGKIGTAVLDKETKKWKDTQTGAELPAGIQTYTANLQGNKDDTGLGASTKNNIDSMLVDMSLAQDTSKQLRSILQKNPAVQGLAGNIRGTVQDVLQAGGEVGQLFNVNMEKMKQDIAAGRVDPEIVKKIGNFDPNIPAVSMLETMLTAQVAKILDPNGRISNDRYKQVSAALGSGGMLGNTAKTMSTLDALDKMIESRRSILSPVSPAAAKIGQQPAAAAPAATPAIRTYNPATGALE